MIKEELDPIGLEEFTLFICTIRNYSSKTICNKSYFLKQVRSNIFTFPIENKTSDCGCPYINTHNKFLKYNGHIIYWSVSL